MVPPEVISHLGMSASVYYSQFTMHDVFLHRACTSRPSKSVCVILYCISGLVFPHSHIKCTASHAAHGRNPAHEHFRSGFHTNRDNRNNRGARDARGTRDKRDNSGNRDNGDNRGNRDNRDNRVMGDNRDRQ